jgi:hypothetical protein
MTVFQSSDLLQAAVAHLIAYVSDRGDSIGTLCGNPNARVYVRGAPDTVTMPYIVLTKAVGQSDPDLSNLCEDIEIDARAVDSDPVRVELLGDLLQQAFLTWRVASSAEGLCRCVGTRRMTPELNEDPAVRDRHEVIVTAECSVIAPRLVDALTPNS